MSPKVFRPANLNKPANAEFENDPELQELLRLEQEEHSNRPRGLNQAAGAAPENDVELQELLRLEQEERDDEERTNG